MLCMVSKKSGRFVIFRVTSTNMRTTKQKPGCEIRCACTYGWKEKNLYPRSLIPCFFAFPFFSCSSSTSRAAANILCTRAESRGKEEEDDGDKREREDDGSKDAGVQANEREKDTPSKTIIIACVHKERCWCRMQTHTHTHTHTSRTPPAEKTEGHKRTTHERRPDSHDSSCWHDIRTRIPVTLTQYHKAVLAHQTHTLPHPLIRRNSGIRESHEKRAGTSSADETRKGNNNTPVQTQDCTTCSCCR